MSKTEKELNIRVIVIQKKYQDAKRENEEMKKDYEEEKKEIENINKEDIGKWELR